MNATPKNTIIELVSQNCGRSYHFRSWRGALKAIDLCYPGVEQERDSAYRNRPGDTLKVIVHYKDWTGQVQVFYLYERALLSSGARLE